MAIDSRVDKIREIASENDDEILSGLIQAAGAFSAIGAVVAAVKGVFDSGERNARFRSAIRALCDELESLGDKLPSDANSALNSDWFRQATQVLIEESSRAANEERAALLGRFTARGCFPDKQDGHRQEELARYIHDLAHLGVTDIQMLKLLCDAYEEPIRITPNLHDPNYFTERFNKFKDMANNLQLHPDDCISSGARLAGFGLAYEATGNNTRMSLGDVCFRPTLRGIYLLKLLTAAETSKEDQH